MAIVGRVTRQPNDVQDYDIDFGDYLPAGDTIVAASMFVAPAMSVPPSFAISTPVVKVWTYAGLTDGVAYKITLIATSADGRKKEVELIVKCKDT